MLASLFGPLVVVAETVVVVLPKDFAAALLVFLPKGREESDDRCISSLLIECVKPGSAKNAEQNNDLGLRALTAFLPLDSSTKRQRLLEYHVNQ